MEAADWAAEAAEATAAVAMVGEERGTGIWVVWVIVVASEVSEGKVASQWLGFTLNCRQNGGCAGTGAMR